MSSPFRGIAIRRNRNLSMVAWQISTFFHDVLNSVDSPDIIEFGFQEVIDLELRRIAANGVLMGTAGENANGALSLSKKHREREGSGTMLLGLSDKVLGAYKRCLD
ncbi:hypothetical protein D9757_001507 [Collybiopsis confluens]|uniref:Uncharacterized protein n=1 Tax=Collybiopsis confluens TaxID=2823264 RepID=A0A8H5MFR8_9AGAR|nr:hypothetical protein D9757_001507 [Collybiopsis confluens]